MEILFSEDPTSETIPDSILGAWDLSKWLGGHGELLPGFFNLREGARTAEEIRAFVEELVQLASFVLSTCDTQEKLRERITAFCTRQGNKWDNKHRNEGPALDFKRYDFTTDSEPLCSISEEALQAILSKYITLQSLLTFIRAQKYTAQQTLVFFQDLLSGFTLNHNGAIVSAILKALEHCIYKNFEQLRLQKLLIHILFSVVVVVFLFEYLIGYVQRGCWATYCDTSWEFRATYVSIELRLAAYFWFKFRASPAQPDRGTKKPRAAKGEPSVHAARNKFEPRLKKKCKAIWLFEYDKYEDAADVFWIGAFYYDVPRKRFTDVVYSWCQARLLPMPPDLNDDGKEEEKVSWVRVQVKNYLTSKHQGGVAVGQYQAGDAVEPYQGHVVPEISETGEGGRPILTADILARLLSPSGDAEFMFPDLTRGGLHQADSTRIDQGQCLSGDITVDDYNVEPPTRQGEVSGQGVGIEGLKSPRTSRDQSGGHQHDFQHFQQSNWRSITLGCGETVPEVGAILQQGETAEHPALMAFAHHPEVADRPNDADEPEERVVFTETIHSTFEELRRRGWGWRIQPRVSNKFHVSFLRRADRDLPELTATNYSAFHELHEQGWKIILEPISNFSPQDGKLET